MRRAAARRSPRRQWVRRTCKPARTHAPRPPPHRPRRAGAGLAAGGGGGPEMQGRLGSGCVGGGRRGSRRGRAHEDAAARRALRPLVLKALPYPINITELQFAVRTVIAVFMWITGILKRPKISGNQLLAVLPLAIFHTMGNFFTNMSLGKVSVSFTQTIKAMEPFFSVLLSALFLGEMPSTFVVLSLPIVGGVALASLTEASFNWLGGSMWFWLFHQCTASFLSPLSSFSRLLQIDKHLQAMEIL